ncbi:MAG: cyclophilin-like family protein [Candidatus Helarchaeota archaeon]
MERKVQSKYDIIIKIPGESEIVKAVLQRIKNPLTAEAIYERLPIQDRARIYKEKEIYIQGIGINRGRENPTLEVQEGVIAYWPLGDGLCFFLDNPPDPYSEVSIVGKITENLAFLASKVKAGTTIIIDRA